MNANRIGLFRDPDYAPCCFLLIKVDGDGFPLPYKGEHESNSVLAQSDWDFPGIARTFGAEFEDHQIGDAGEWLRENAARADMAWRAEVVADDPGYFNS